MKIFQIHKNVMSGQCKNALLRLQVRYTAIFLFPGLFKGWTGSQIGLFIPWRPDYREDYRCTGFYFRPWFARDISVMKLPVWYRKLTKVVSFEFGW